MIIVRGCKHGSKSSKAHSVKNIAGPIPLRRTWKNLTIKMGVGNVMFSLVILGEMSFSNGREERIGNHCSGRKAQASKGISMIIISSIPAWLGQGPIEFFKWQYWRVDDHGTRHSKERLGGYKATESKVEVEKWVTQRWLKSVKNFLSFFNFFQFYYD